MKKTFALVLTLTICLFLVGCGERTTDQPEVKTESNAAENSDTETVEDENAAVPPTDEVGSDSEMEMDTESEQESPDFAGFVSRNGDSGQKDTVPSKDTTLLADNLTYESVEFPDGILFTIKNQNDSIVANCDAVIVYYDSDNNMLDTEDGFIQGIPAHSTTMYAFWTDEPYDHYELQLSTPNYLSSAYDLKDNVTTEISEAKLSEGKVIAKFANDGSDMIDYASAVCLFYDKNHDLIALESDSMFDIDAGQFATVEFYGPKSFDSYEVHLTAAIQYTEA